jgi:membrane-associated phospholipid phosphatase
MIKAVAKMASTAGASEANMPASTKILLMLLVTALQLFTFFLTYRLYAAFDITEYVQVRTSIDALIPYMKWTWTIYYFGFIYVMLWSVAGIWNQQKLVIQRTITVYCGLILAGAVLRMIIPTDSPWPLVAELTTAQRAFKSACNVEPLAGFPSMHVALSVLTAFMNYSSFRSVGNRVVSVVLAILVSASVVTAKEHWFLDVVSGTVIGLVAGWIWKRYAYKGAAFDSQAKGL